MLPAGKPKRTYLKAIPSWPNMKNVIIKAALMMLVAGLPTLLFAQPGFDEQVYDVAVPFDDGTVVLVAIGIVYGLLRIRAYRKNEKMKKVLLHIQL